MIYAPVLSLQAGQVKIVPLNNFPQDAPTDWMDSLSDGSKSWSEYHHRIGCGLGRLVDDAEAVRKIYQCNGITRNSLSDYNWVAFLIAILQKVATSDEFEIVYKVNPKHIYDELVLFETNFLKTKWKRQLAQMN